MLLISSARFLSPKLNWGEDGGGDKVDKERDGDGLGDQYSNMTSSVFAQGFLGHL